MAALCIHKIPLLFLIGLTLVNQSSPSPFEIPEVTSDFPLETSSNLYPSASDADRIAVLSAHHYLFERIRRLPSVEAEDDRPRRTFPEIDSRGFDEDVFDEGFGEWYPMKRF
ncbi:hypothetical protein AVEN_27837-1 [Araneus ventricosus]|uniref:Uncharacterized protein n=1 Tax=Araneus ventricosus TaxID=182803 RepID=A0A4Y2GP47_ARAVE|nr:hypothetical protein AVEN_27837-1 [Araneus ventricosus]